MAWAIPDSTAQITVTLSSVIIFSHKNHMLNLIKERREVMVSYMLPNRSLICPSKPGEVGDPSQRWGGGDASGWLRFAQQGDTAFNMVPLTWMWRRCGLGRQLEHLMPIYKDEHYSFQYKGQCASPEPRTWDFTRDPTAQDALMALLVGLLSKGKRQGRNAWDVSLPALDSHQAAFAVLWFPASPLGAKEGQSPALRCP